MNEWSLGGNYSRPVTPNQPGQLRSYRSQWDDHNAEKTTGSRQLIVNVRTVTDSRSKPTFQQRSTEDISRTSIPSATKKKKSGSGTSDPRFKRMLSPSPQKDACVETEIKNSRTPIAEEEDFNPLNSNPKTDYQCGDSVQNSEPPSKINTTGDKPFEHKNSIVPCEQFVFDPIVDHLKEMDKLTFNPDIVFPKKSISDCTIRTKNTSCGSDDIADEYLTRFPSATRVSKVHNWIKEQKSKAEKRRSVITVIGQTQGQQDLNFMGTTFQEIDQRKKLAKELDKHAFCKKLVASVNKDKIVNNLVSRINFLGTPGKGFSGGDRILGLNDFAYDCGNLNAKGYGDEDEKKPEWSAGGMIDAGDKTERLQDSGASSKKLGRRRKSRKSHSANFWDIRGKMENYLDHFSAQWLIYFVIVVSGFFCYSTFLALQQNNFFAPFDWFPVKPKTVTWYEKVLNWIWELFRPAGSYRRSSSWNMR